jgi:hypothetical protein
MSIDRSSIIRQVSALPDHQCTSVPLTIKADQSQQELDWRKEELSNVITETLRRQPYLCYFQGYHDICQVLLLVLGPRACVPAVLRLSVLRIRDFMLPSLAPALSHLHLLPSILHAADPSLCRHLSSTQPFFALAATLTLYAHDIQEYGDIARLFDVLLAREASYSIYLFARVRRSRPTNQVRTLRSLAGRPHAKERADGHPP